MDKKNFIIGILLIGAALAYQAMSDLKRKEYEYAQRLKEAESAKQVVSTESGAIAASDAQKKKGAGIEFTVGSDEEVTEKAEAVAAALGESVPEKVSEVVEELAEEKSWVLENEDIRVVFTSHGGAIREIALKKHKKENTDNEGEIPLSNMYVINEGSSVAAMSLAMEAEPKGFETNKGVYSLVALEADQIVFERASAEFKVQRTYRFAKAGTEEDPYQIYHKTEVFNLDSKAPKTLGDLSFNVGTAHPVASDEMGQFLNFGYYAGVEEPEAEFIPVVRFKGSNGVFGIGASSAVPDVKVSGNVFWGSVKNQFFTTVVTPTSAAQKIISYPVEYKNELDKNGAPVMGVTGDIIFDPGLIPAAGSKALEMNFYAGPKEYTRLEALGARQDLIMEFGFFEFISRTLLSFMRAIYELSPEFMKNWGVAIILMTVCIKLIFWPLTAKAARSQKAMQKIQEPLKELREKYKDNPQKIQKETMKLFKENRVNPLAGCFPILIQIPIFFALFWMLRSATELRFADFLWITDLSQPDTVATAWGFPINIMPLIMGATQVVQMRMMPTPATSGNNEMAEMQQKMFKIMPFIFLVFCYFFSSGLVLYWTVQNILTITQQAITNRSKDEPLPVIAEKKDAKPRGPRNNPKKNKKSKTRS